MVFYLSFFVFIFSYLNPVHAQDERYFRKIFSEDILKSSSFMDEKKEIQFKVMGPNYFIDLNDDKIEEIIQIQKRDGVDWLEIKNFSLVKIFETKLVSMGGESSVYKLKLVKISSTVTALIVFLDEGKTNGKKFESTGRIFVLSYENDDLSKISTTLGPHFFHEQESQREQYWRKNYDVRVIDLNNDGIREITVTYNHIQRIMKYKGSGIWERF